MEGKEFLEVAERLSNSNHEADRRTSVSRSYYAMFNHIKSFLKPKITFTNTPEDHRKIYYYFHNCGVEEAEDIASGLNVLRQKRNDADYNMNATGFDSKNCALLYLKAKISINKFDKIDRRALLEGIKEYIRKTNK